MKIAQILREENVSDVNENYAAAVDRGISKVRIQILVGKPRYFRFENCPNAQRRKYN